SEGQDHLGRMRLLDRPYGYRPLSQKRNTSICGRNAGSKDLSQERRDHGSIADLKGAVRSIAGQPWIGRWQQLWRRVRRWLWLPERIAFPRAFAGGYYRANR